MIDRKQDNMEAFLESSPTKGIVLLVDDEATIIDVCTLMLQRLGYDVIEARDGQSAIRIFKENKHIVNLVILDMQMPGINGADTYVRLKRIKSDVRVLLASGYFENQRIRDILKNGCDDFIQKPFNFAQLSEKLKDIMNCN
jgi:DNA-binding response OmpR family regulator